MNKGYIARKVRGAKRRARGFLVRLGILAARPQTPPAYSDNNRVYNHPKLENASIVFKGKNNILYCESSNTIFQHCKISFEGDNSVFYISKHSNKNRKYRTNIFINDSSVLYIGRNTNFHPGGQAYLVASENKNIIIGDDCLFSLNLLFRTSDGHAAYDSATKKRINHGKSMLIGDHVWLGQNVTILKGSRIGSGSIVGAGSIVTGKTLASNTSNAGTPARTLKQGVFFAKPNINMLNEEQLREIDVQDTEDWIYSQDDTTLSFDDIDAGLMGANTSRKKLAYIKKHLGKNHSKNRFYLP